MDPSSPAPDSPTPGGPTPGGPTPGGPTPGGPTPGGPTPGGPAPGGPAPPGTVSAAARYSLIRRVAVLSSVDCSVLARRRAVVVGCGALGSAVAMHLVRVGAGEVRIIDRDIVEHQNLADQALYCEEDARRGRCKAEAAATHLAGANLACTVEPVVADFAAGNALRICDGADLLIDGADNLETKLLLNDVAVETGIPLVYAGCAGTEGSVLAVQPGLTHCLRCLWPNPGESAARLTCQTRGLLPGTAAAVAALQFTEALKLLLGVGTGALSGLLRIDVWDGVLRRVPLPEFHAGPRACPACQNHDLSYLRGEHTTTARELCGDDTVLLHARGADLDLGRLRLRQHGNASLRTHPECVSFELEGCRIIAFSSGRTLIHGAGGVNRARALYARHVLG